MGHRSATRGERGSVGGAEAVAFGVLILVAGSLLITNLWTVIETRVAVDAAAREYLRAYTHGTEHGPAADAAEWTARSTLAARGTPLSQLRIEPPVPGAFGPCGRATVTLAATVPAMRVPFLGTLSETEVRVTHAELIGAHREVTSHDLFDPSRTPCVE